MINKALEDFIWKYGREGLKVMAETALENIEKKELVEFALKLAVNAGEVLKSVYEEQVEKERKEIEK